MVSNQKKAADLFAEGFSCSQSVLAAHAQQLDVPLETALRLSAAFGGGMGRHGEVCGAATGALMVIGLASGHIAAEDKEGKERTYGLANQFLQEFDSRNGSIYCPELLGCRLDTPEGQAQAREQALFSTICPRLVAGASELLAEMLSEYLVPGDTESD
jgi:C_GCAxxG_C_C family probable redox protein